MDLFSEDLKRYLGSPLALDPREGEDTEVIEKGGGKNGRDADLRNDPRPGESTEPLEEGERPLAAARLGDQSESLPQG